MDPADLAALSPPHSDLAERSLLGALLRFPDDTRDALDKVRPEDFYFARHAMALAAAKHLAAAGVRIDLVGVYEEAKRRGQAKDVTPQFLAELWDCTSGSGLADYHASIVCEYAAKRWVIRAASGLVGDMHDLRGETALDALQRLYTAALDAISSRTGGNPVLLRDVLGDVYRNIDERQNAGRDIGLPTGLSDLNEMTGGFHPGQLVVLAARPGGGKSALGSLFAVEASNHGPALFVSLEMSRHDLAERMLAAEGRVSQRRIRFGQMSRAEGEQVYAAGERLGRRPIYVEDSPNASVAGVRSMVRHLKRNGGLALAVVDYLGLLTPESKRVERQEQISQMTRSLKLLAREAAVPVVLLAQLNRDSEKAARRPRLSDLRESGAIEQDADVVMFLHRPGEGRPPPGEPERIELIVEKQRNGPTGTRELDYSGWLFRFDTHDPTRGGAKQQTFI